MAFVHGKNTKFQLDNSGGALQNISQYVTSASLQRMQELLDTTTFGASAKTYIGGFPDAKIPLSGHWDPTIDAHLSGILGMETVSFEFYPQGDASGRPKYTGEAILTSYEQSAGINQVTGWSGELQVTGAVTRSLVA